jgi:hypothetical protein
MALCNRCKSIKKATGSCEGAKGSEEGNVKVLVSDFEGTMTQDDLNQLAIDLSLPRDVPDFGPSTARKRA